MKTIFLIGITTLFISITALAQESADSKPTFLFGYGRVLNFTSTEVVGKDRSYPELKFGFNLSVEMHIPTKFSKNIKYDFGGIYYVPKGTVINDGINAAINMAGGGFYGGLNATFPFTKGNFGIGLSSQVDIGYYNFQFGHYDSGLNNNVPDRNLSAFGSNMKFGLFIRFKKVSFTPQFNIQNIGSQKTGKTLMGTWFGLKLGYDI
jgi:hypothetical protein